MAMDGGNLIMDAMSARPARRAAIGRPRRREATAAHRRLRVRCSPYGSGAGNVNGIAVGVTTVTMSTAC